MAGTVNQGDTGLTETAWDHAYDQIFGSSTGNTYRVRTALEVSGLSCQLKPIGLPNSDHKTDSHPRMNPMDQVALKRDNPVSGGCQIKLNQSHLGQSCCPLCNAEIAPHGSSSGAVTI